MDKTRKTLNRFLNLYGAQWEFQCDHEFDRNGTTISEAQVEQFMLLFAQARLVTGGIRCEAFSRGRNGKLYVFSII